MAAIRGPGLAESQVFFWQRRCSIRPCLRPLNRLWLKFGLLLHKVVNPIVMALVFFGTVLPTGLIMRVLGKDLLRLKRQPDANSYWIERRPPGPAPGIHEGPILRGKQYGFPG